MQLDAEDAIDLVGTGGDRKDTFNITTLSALTVAACGHRVVKHGNGSASSKHGSSDTLRSVGVDFRQTEAGLRRQLDAANVTFVHAPLFHPALAPVAPVRRALGVATLFNLLGPLVNPAQPGYHYIGVADARMQGAYAASFEGHARGYNIVHAMDDYDEATLTGPVRCFTHHGRYTIQPRDVDLPPTRPEEITVAADPTAQFMTILRGEGSAAQTDTVALNAGLAIELLTGGTPQCLRRGGTRSPRLRPRLCQLPKALSGVSVLDDINARRRLSVAAQKAQRPQAGLELEASRMAREPISLSGALRTCEGPRVIAEHKRASPSEGDYGCPASLSTVVDGYASANATALSILTEGERFGGSLDHLRAARARVALPLLRKDFIVDEYQLLEARLAGADAVLLIAAGLSLKEAQRFCRKAHALQLEVLLELHDESELDYLSIGPDVVGVNNRNLKTLAIDLATSRRMLALLPTDVPRLSESGIKTAPDAAELIALGYDGLLVGTQFMKTDDPGRALANFLAQTRALL